MIKDLKRNLYIYIQLYFKKWFKKAVNVLMFEALTLDSGWKAYCNSDKAIRTVFVAVRVSCQVAGNENLFKAKCMPGLGSLCCLWKYCELT